MLVHRFGVIVGVFAGLLVGTLALEAEAATPAPSCARPAAGAVVAAPPALRSRNGSLAVDLDYILSFDKEERTLHCFITRDGQESPTLYVNPGDTLDITLRNRLPPLPAREAPDMVMDLKKVCGDASMNAHTVNMHFHGTNTTPTCHSDEVIRTLVNPGGVFHYRIQFPKTEPPGLYWYHPHVHGYAEASVLAGATGAIVVEGIEKIQPAVAGLPERILVMRDQLVPGLPTPGGKVPSWDLSLNYVPISYPAETPGVIKVKPGRQEFWRVVNAGADTVSDIVLQYDGVDQPLQVVALDGVPTGSQDGRGMGRLVGMTHILLAPASRAEFIVTTPTTGVKEAAFVSRRVDVGPAGDNDPTRTLAMIKVDKGGGADGEPMASIPIPAATSVAPAQLFDGLDSAKVDTQRRLYFSEVFEDHPDKPRVKHDDNDGPIQFYITEFGHKPRLFSPDNPPAITTTQGSVEEWTIENRTQEVHAFHIHQIHFKLMERDGAVLPPRDQQYLDTVEIPYWKGHGPYPSVTVLMDFRGDITGDFVYHCHILEHEDGGMMAIIRVKPRADQSS
jgi:FtsP/CotA-like multicopper oxidase with cupredoxin domain